MAGPRPSGSSARTSSEPPTTLTPSGSPAACRSRRPCRRRRGLTSPRPCRLWPCQRGLAHDGDSQISEADCLIRLDNFRWAYTVNYRLSDLEAQLYREVTEYVRDGMNRAERLAQEGEGRRGNLVG